MSRETVLVVDDDPQIARLVRGYLEQEGFQVSVLNDGNSALASIRGARPDLVVLDLMLPGLSGLDITRAVRSDPAIAATPILMLTARVDDVDRILGLELGADDYVTKPFNPREVVARVKAILRRSRSDFADNVGAGLIFGDLQLKPAERTVTKSGSAVKLTPSEFDILYLLMRNQGRAFSRTQIIEDGLGLDYAGLERTVDSHIKNLRRKIENDPHSPRYLETVFGVGYRFVG